MTERYRVMNHDDYELDYIADSQQSFKKVDLYDCCDLLNELTEENQKLQQQTHRLKECLLLLLEDLGDNPSEMDTLCQSFFNCNYERAKEKYGELSKVMWGDNND